MRSALVGWRGWSRECNARDTRSWKGSRGNSGWQIKAVRVVKFGRAGQLGRVKWLEKRRKRNEEEASARSKIVWRTLEQEEGRGNRAKPGGGHGGRGNPMAQLAARAINVQGTSFDITWVVGAGARPSLPAPPPVARLCAASAGREVAGFHLLCGAWGGHWWKKLRGTPRKSGSLTAPSQAVDTWTKPRRYLSIAGPPTPVFSGGAPAGDGLSIPFNMLSSAGQAPRRRLSGHG